MYLDPNIVSRPAPARRILAPLALGILLAACEENDLGDPLTVRTATIVGEIEEGGKPVSKATVRIEGTNLETLTGVDGRFRLDLVPPDEEGILDVEYQAPDGIHRRRRQTVDPEAGEVLDVGTVALERTGSVSGMVTREGAARHGGTDVFIPGTSFWVRTGLDGAFEIARLPGGWYKVAALVTGYRGFVSAEFEVTPGETTVLGAVQLRPEDEDEPRGDVTGRVISPIGVPLEHAIVSLTPSREAVVTGEDGGYRFEDLYATEYLVRAELEGKISNSVRVTVEKGQTITAHIPLYAQPDQDKPGRAGWNAAPTLRLACPESVAAGGHADLVVTALDPDGDPVTLGEFDASAGSIAIVGEGATCEPEPGGVCRRVRWVAGDRPGTYEISVTATDGQLTARAVCEVVVSSAQSTANRCPAVALTGPTRALVGRTLDLTAAGFDADGDPLSFAWLAAAGRLDRTSGERVVWTAPQEAGDYGLSACVTDGLCPRACTEVKLGVAKEDEKKLFPACYVAGPSLAAAGSAVGLRAVTYDPNAYPVSTSWSAQSGVLSTAEGAAVNWMAPQQPGAYTVSCLARAASGSTVTCQIGIIVVEADAANACPLVSVSGPSTGVTGMPARLDFEAEDADNGPSPLTLTCRAPNGIFFTHDIESDEAVFEWLPFFEGVSTFVCEASDGACLMTRYHAISIAEKPDDLPPIVSLICTVDELLPGQTTVCIAIGADPEDKDVTFKWSAPAGAFSSAAGESVTWTAPPSSGEYALTVTGGDGAHETQASSAIRVKRPVAGRLAGGSGAEGVLGEYACDPSTIALYHFSETDGPPVRDACGSLDATLRGASIAGPGQRGRGYYLNGVEDSVEVASAAVAGLANGTIELWVKPVDTRQDYDLLYRKGEEGKWDVRVQYTVRTQSWGLTWDDDCSGARQKLSQDSATDPGYHHLAITWDGTTWRMYQDGILGVVAPDVYGLAEHAEPLVVGRSVPGTERPFRGWIDELRISDRAREPEEFRVLDRPESPLWSAKSNMPTARSEVGLGLAAGKLYILGGRTAGTQATGANEVYDPLKDSWEKKKELPTPRWDAATAAVGRLVFVIGGARYKDKHELLAKTEEYDTDADTWTTGPNWPKPRFGAAAASVDQQVFVVGGSSGIDGDGNLARLDRYEPVTRTWSERAPMPTPRSRPAVAVLGGELYVIGGKTDTGFSPVNERYNPRTNSWTPLAAMPTARRAAAAVAVNDFIYVIGGENDATLDLVEAYDPVKDTWTSLDEFPDARYGHVVGSFQRFISVIGGRNADSILSSVQQGFLLPPSPE
ncbi:MAG: carboxypeptidase regulatory-like domain-containing protein [Nitrospirae bacterium]|nr:carboxypeptidase regulatory-like domain-containing protein [Nitrospirota bacterium]